MIRHARWLALFAVTVAAAAAACTTADNNEPPAAEDAGGRAPIDGGATPRDAYVADTTVADVSVDTSITTVIDSATPVDANEPQDAGLDAPFDATDAAADAPIDAPGDAPIDAPVDAYDSGLACVTHVFGDYYTRADGTAVHATASTGQSVVMNGTTNQPLKSIVQIAAQIYSACALLSDQTVWCWAAFDGTLGNQYGDLGNGAIGGNASQFVASQVVTNAADAGAPTYLTGVLRLNESGMAVYAHPTCAIRTDKTLWCWGYSTAQGSGPDGLFWGTLGTHASSPYAIELAAGPTDAGITPITADHVAVGGRFLCYILNGVVSCMGDNVYGNLANGDATNAFKPYPSPILSANGLPSSVDAVVAASDFACALAQGGVWCWGAAGQDEIGNPAAAVSICNSNYCIPAPTPVQVSAPDGGLTVVGDSGVYSSPLQNVTTLAGGYLSTCALDSNGIVYCWGGQSSGIGLAEATPYVSSSLPDTNITMMSLSGSAEYPPQALTYTTASGTYVAGSNVIPPDCQ